LVREDFKKEGIRRERECDEKLRNQAEDYQ